MAHYIKVTPAVAQALQLTDIRNRTADGNYLLWQADIAGIEGGTLAGRAAAVGGVCLTPAEARAETDGTAAPAPVTTPDGYQAEPQAEAEPQPEPTDGGTNEEGGTL